MRKKGIAGFVIALCIVASCSKPSVEPSNPNPPVETIRVELNELIYAGTAKGTVCAFNATDGKVKWSTSLFHAILNVGFSSSPTLVNGILYICTPFSNVIALDGATGAIKWTRSLDNPERSFFSSPLVVNNILYVGHQNTLYAINTADGTIAWTYAAPGSVTKQFDVSSPCYGNGVVYINSVDWPERGLFSLNAQTGALVAKYGIDRPTVVSPCFADNAVYTVVTNADGSTGSVLKFNTIGLPNLVASYPILRSSFSSPTVFNKNIYIGSSNYLYSYKGDSALNVPLRWRFEAATDLQYSTPTADSSRVYIVGNDGTLFAVNDTTGKKDWEFKSNNMGVISASSPTVANGVVYYSGVDGLYALNAKTGKKIWSNTDNGGMYSSPCVIDKSGKVYHSGISGIKN